MMCVVQSSQVVEGILSAKQYLKLNLARITDGVFMLLFCCNIYDFPLRIYNIKQSHRKTGPTQELLKQTNHYTPPPPTTVNKRAKIHLLHANDKLPFFFGFSNGVWHVAADGTRMLADKVVP